MILRGQDVDRDGGGRITTSTNLSDSVRRGKENLYRCLAYCLEEGQCRRVMLLNYFGEDFPREACMSTCDNCRLSGGEDVVPQDYTAEALAVVKLLKNIITSGFRQITLINLAKVVSGTKAKELSKFPSFKTFFVGGGSGNKDLSKDVAEKLLLHMLCEGFLEEEQVETASGFPAYYIVLGSKAVALERGTATLELRLRKKGAVASTSSAGASSRLSTSSNVSANEIGMEIAGVCVGCCVVLFYLLLFWSR